MAPLDTSTTRRPPALACAAPAAILSHAAPPSASAREPILRTTRRALTTLLRSPASAMSAVGLREELLEARLEPAQEPPREPRGRGEHAVDHRRRGVAQILGWRGGGRAAGARVGHGHRVD